MAVIVAGVEQGVVTELVHQVDLGEVETGAGGYRQPRRDIESVGRVEAGIERRCAQSDRRHVAGGQVDEETDALHEGKLVGIDGAQLARGRELHQPAVDAHPHHEIVVMTEHFFRGGRLHRAAETVGRRPGAVDFAQHARPQQAGGRHRLSRCGYEIRHSAIEIGKAQHGRVGASGILRVRAVAVDVRLVEIAEIGIRLVRPRIARLPARARGQEGELILRRLR